MNENMIHLITKIKKCPVHGCTKTWVKRSGLEAHLHNWHLKHEIIKAFLDVLEI